MPHAITRGRSGRRHEVDFGDAPVRVQALMLKNAIRTRDDKRREVNVFHYASIVHALGSLKSESRRFSVFPPDAAGWQISEGKCYLI